MILPLLLAAAEGTHTLLDPHGFGLVFWTGIIFACVALILYRVAWAPMLEALRNREEAIAGSIAAAQRTRAEAEQLKQRYEDHLETARQEAQAIINEGEADKKRIVSEATAVAVREAGEIKARAERDIQLAKGKALAEVKAEATTLGLAIAERVLRAEIDAQKHKSLMDQVIASYGRS